jgi:hypothetical protein
VAASSGSRRSARSASFLTRRGLSERRARSAQSEFRGATSG